MKFRIISSLLLILILVALAVVFMSDSTKQTVSHAASSADDSFRNLKVQ